MDGDTQFQLLKKIIEESVFVTNAKEQIREYSSPEAWVFDFRRVLMNGKVSDLLGEVFYNRFNRAYPFQLGTLEIGGVPLATTLMNKLYAKGHDDINAFFVRKSRKKTGLLQMIEGKVLEGRKIVLVDDTMNSGDSFWRQIVALEEMGHRVDIVWSIIRYRDMPYYKRFHDRGIKVESLFTLDDFTETLGSRVKNLVSAGSGPAMIPFTFEWAFKSERPSLNYVLPKSQPVIDNEVLYVGTDSEKFYAINQCDGTVKWIFKVGPHTRKKSIFSSPVLANDLVIFGSYDGNVYALDKESGKKRWVSFEADWVGSSPAVAPELGLVFIGLEFGLFQHHGGIAALDIKTGRTIWIDRSHKALTHASPAYIPLHEQVVIGSNEGIIRLYDAHTGGLLWKFTTFGGADFDGRVDSGFGNGEIKQSIAYDETRDYLIFGATDGFLYILERATGHLVHHYKCAFAVWATPYVHQGKVYFSSLDKRVRCVDLDSFELVFEKDIDGTRIFCSPTVIDGRLYVGTNAARLHELNIHTGVSIGYFQTRERITNTIIKNAKTGRFFLPTYANEIICLKK
jgi:outer membrane protein assembly factor BamB/adenine/guanine phosphoribosyltransferase-like PRPP-binding protein